MDHINLCCGMMQLITNALQLLFSCASSIILFFRYYGWQLTGILLLSGYSSGVAAADSPFTSFKYFIFLALYTSRRPTSSFATSKISHF